MLFRQRRFSDGTFRRWWSQMLYRVKKCFWKTSKDVWLDCKGCMLDKHFCCHPEGRCGFSSARSLKQLSATVTMCGRQLVTFLCGSLWRFFLLVCGISEFTQKLSLDNNYCHSFCIVILITFHSWSIFVLSSCRLPISVRFYSYFQCLANSCFPECELLFQQRGARDCLWANTHKRLAEWDVIICFEANSSTHTYNQMPSKLFLWTSDKFSWPPWPWIPTAEIFLEQLSRVDTMGVSSKIWKHKHWSLSPSPKHPFRKGWPLNVPFQLKLTLHTIFTSFVGLQ